MTNLQIISGAAILSGVTGDVDTFPGWKRRGRQVKQGEKCLFKTKIWKPRGKKKSAENEDEETDGSMIMVTAAFFGESQTEPITE